MASFRTHYDNLKIPRDATRLEIRQAYKKLCQKYHPDKNRNDPDATRKLTIINQAYVALMNSGTRRKHDAWIAIQEGRFQKIPVDDTPVSGPYSDPDEVLAEIRRYQKRNRRQQTEARSAQPGRSSEASKPHVKPSKSKPKKDFAESAGGDTPVTTRAGKQNHRVDRIDTRALRRVRRRSAWTTFRYWGARLWQRGGMHQLRYPLIVILAVALLLLTTDSGQDSSLPPAPADMNQVREDVMEYILLEEVDSLVEKNAEEEPKEPSWLEENIF